MKSKFLFIFLLVASFSWIDSVILSVDAHEAQLQPTNNFIMIENETFNRESMQTGETLTVQGNLVNLSDKDTRGWLSIFSESTDASNRWEMLARDPPEIVFDVPKNSVVEYLLSAKALEPGVYHIHTQFNIDKVGPELGPGQIIVVQGEPIIKHIPFTNIAYELILIIIGNIIVIVMVYYFWKKIK